MVNMEKNTITKRVVEAFQQCPGWTTRQIAERTGLSHAAVSSRLVGLVKTGVMRRHPEEVNGVKMFRYWVKDVNAKPKRVKYGTGRKAAKGRASVTQPTDPNPVTVAAMEEARSKSTQAAQAPMTLHRPEVSLDSMMEAMATRMANQLLSRVMSKFSEAAGFDKGPSIEELRSRMPQKQEEKKPMRSILIVGLLPAQAGQIQAEFHDCFDLRFWKDESADRLKAMAQSADLAITFTSKIGHWVEEIIQSSHVQLIRAPGGMTRLREILTEVYAKE
jgi:DNA-binding Lrp family transcriptional regulator